MSEIIAAVYAHQYLLTIVLAWPIVLAVGNALSATPLGPYVSIARLPSWARWLIGQGLAGVSVFVALVSQGVAAPDAGLAAFLSAAGVEWTATAGKRLSHALGAK